MLYLNLKRSGTKILRLHQLEVLMEIFAQPDLRFTSILFGTSIFREPHFVHFYLQQTKMAYVIIEGYGCAGYCAPAVESGPTVANVSSHFKSWLCLLPSATPEQTPIDAIVAAGMTYANVAVDVRWIALSPCALFVQHRRLLKLTRIYALFFHVDMLSMAQPVSCAGAPRADARRG